MERRPEDCRRGGCQDLVLCADASWLSAASDRALDRYPALPAEAQRVVLAGAREAPGNDRAWAEDEPANGEEPANNGCQGPAGVHGKRGAEGGAGSARCL